MNQIRSFKEWLTLMGIAAVLLPGSAQAAKALLPDQFRQLDSEWPTPTNERRPSGAPGHEYWQQRADYKIDVTIDDEKQTLTGHETITYHNNSPDTLKYLWVQLDQQVFSPDSGHWLTSTAPDLKGMTYDSFNGLLYTENHPGALKIRSVKGADGSKLAHTIVDTQMRIDLPEPLKPGASTSFSIGWRYKINNAKATFARNGYEFFEKDGNYLYCIAQWFPRMAAYTDNIGWQNRQYMNSAEFALEFGDYLVSITVPDDHIVASSGVLQNPKDILTKEQIARLKEAETADKPVMIVTREEAEANEKEKGKGTKTWIYKADNVRDFAFSTSRKFLWDAQGIPVGNRRVMAMSYWPKEGDPLWSQYSTHAVAHTLDVYGKFTFEYPYPVAISVNGPITGMEYPMICFQRPRPEEDGTYSERTKYGLISVIIHEVGHNWFPMIVNSDERQWMWMDEGFNSFVQYLSEREWEDEYPDRISRIDRRAGLKNWMMNGPARPIMSDSDTLLSRGYNAYAKPTVAFNILRETILGRELFDFAFKEYSQRWMFKRPTPYDFFRTMEDASGMDLDWFWRGWFYTIDHVDLSLDGIRHFRLETRNPKVDKKFDREARDAEPMDLTRERNQELEMRIDRYPELKDFYNSYDPLNVTEKDKADYEKLLKGLKPEERKLLKTKEHFYIVDVTNVGGLVMPVILELLYADGTTEERRYPAEIWRRSNDKISKLLITDKEITSIHMDPQDEIFDADLDNNYFPRRIGQETFQLRKSGTSTNPMRVQKKFEEEQAKKKAAEEKKAKEAEEKKGE